MRIVALIGTSHCYQHPENPDAGAFRAFVEQACATSRVRAIAEEMSLEAVSQKNAIQSLCKKIADAAGLLHRYCDLNNEQRQALHIQDEQVIKANAWLQSWDQERVEREVRASHEIRERHWLNELLTLDIWPILFVCGANHIEPFRVALETSGFRVDIVIRDWSPS